MEENPNRHTASGINWWASEASLNTVNVGSNVRIDDKSYQPLSVVDEDEDRRKKKEAKEDTKTASTLALSNVNSNGVGLVAFSFNSVQR
jgi:hypothetical protein